MVAPDDDRSLTKSITRQSCFDWGMSLDGESFGEAAGSLGSGKEGSASNNKGPSSRYDPKAMSRIVDITDLVDEADESDDDEVIGHSSGMGGVRMNGVTTKPSKSLTPGQSRYGPSGIGGGDFVIRQALILVALVGIIIAASLAIGYAVPSSVLGSRNSGGVGNEQLLLETAERVIVACSESALNEDMKSCQKICKNNMCCFETGQYSCKADEKKMCAAYVGCEALVEGIPLEGAEEDEE